MKYANIPCIALSFLTSSCGTFTYPEHKPVIEDALKTSFFGEATMGILAVTPERRMVIQEHKSGKFCAEYPTDVGVDLSNAMQLVTSAEIPDKVKAELSLAMASASNNRVLNKRSYSLQLFLSASYALCQAGLNSNLTDERYIQEQAHIFDTTALLLAREIDNRTPTAADQPASQPPAPSVQSATNALADFLKSGIAKSAPSSPSSPSSPSAASAAAGK